MLDQIDQIHKIFKQESEKEHIKFPLKVEIDWTTADWEALKEFKDRHKFSISSPINNGLNYDINNYNINRK